MGIVSAASVARLARWVRSGPTSPVRGRAADRVAARAGLAQEDARGRPAAPRVAGAAARAAPCSRARRGSAPRSPRRPRSPCARAGRRRTPRTGRGRRPGVVASSRIRFVSPGISSTLRFELRDPEAVDHVGGRADDVDPRVDRDVHLVRGDRRRARVADLPPPLVRDHPDGQLRRPGRGRRGRAHDEDVRPDEERREQHDRHGDAEDDDEPVAARSSPPPTGQARRGRDAASRGRAGRRPDPKPTHADAEHDPEELDDRRLLAARRVQACSGFRRNPRARARGSRNEDIERRAERALRFMAPGGRVTNELAAAAPVLSRWRALNRRGRLCGSQEQRQPGGQARGATTAPSARGLGSWPSDVRRGTAAAARPGLAPTRAPAARDGQPRRHGRLTHRPWRYPAGRLEKPGAERRMGLGRRERPCRDVGRSPGGPTRALRRRGQPPLPVLSASRPAAEEVSARRTPDRCFDPAVGGDEDRRKSRVHSEPRVMGASARARRSFDGEAGE